MNTTSVVELVPKARKLLFELQTQQTLVETGKANAEDVYFGLSELSQQLNILESLVNNERPAQRESWRKKLTELQRDVDFLRASLDRHVAKSSSGLREQQERQELLLRRTQAMPSSVVENYMEEGAALTRSQAMVEDLTYTGQAIMANLLDQRSTLKSAQRKILDLANLLGLSGVLMRSANRRDATDKWIVFGGMIITLGFLYFCYWYSTRSTTSVNPN
uniref:Golgi SNAP receptor complex member 2 n=1 Tax=Fibrocapsa japonica TaxID=94617 RepID=A0A7S2XZE9_9STRA|mmetsp:Transcript_24279/g.35306  ORF Transcript_24279/g.35306 Transcript_24279/m.35306 type:complete len:219 (+) Transcript_24279:72-728(+)